MHNLNPAQLEKLAAGWHADGGGLALVVTEAGSRSWVLKYTVKGVGARKTIGLGGLKDFSLKEARRKAEDIRTAAREGRDPKRVLNAEAHDNRVIPTFGQLADLLLPTFIEGLKSQKTVEKWERDLQRHAKPIRDIRVDKITTEQVLALLMPHYKRAPSMARELRGRIERVFAASMVLPSREAPHRPRAHGNPAELKGNLDIVIPKLPPRGKQKGPQPSMPYTQLPAFIPVVRSSHGVVAKALLLVILTGLRTDEARELQWTEIDLDDAVIRLDKRRMKNNLDAEVPLSPAAIVLLRELKRDAIGDYVFPGRKPGQPISSDAMLKFLQTGKGQRPDCTVHGFRTSFRSWGQDVSTHSRETLEFCLHHIEGGEAERAYKQGSMLAKRRAALSDWADFVLPRSPKLRVVA